MTTTKAPPAGIEIASQFRHCPRCGASALERHSEKSVSCPACGFLFFFNIAAAVAALITDPEGRLLVTKRALDPAQGTLDLPGGFVDPHETAEEAFIYLIGTAPIILLTAGRLNTTVAVCHEQREP